MLFEEYLQRRELASLYIKMLGLEEHLIKNCQNPENYMTEEKFNEFLGTAAALGAGAALKAGWDKLGGWKGVKGLAGTAWQGLNQTGSDVYNKYQIDQENKKQQAFAKDYEYYTGKKVDINKMPGAQSFQQQQVSKQFAQATQGLVKNIQMLPDNQKNNAMQLLTQLQAIFNSSVG